ncbi:histidine--tRNA ligase [Atopococcus tabaci]|uniref:histidine--tRNA ligase n=1 Tax=Atopococcus tabaci TaxID=269774 RepID=UPI0004101928|nr:histidine--tRNA ligase [Atopococcus tabaci]
MNYKRPKGTADILPNETKKWQFVEKTAKKVLDAYRFNEIRTPLFESFDLFSRGVGETSDIVSKEMYDFYDKGKRHIALRPEGTASIVRAYVENKLYGPEHGKPLKVYYNGPMFRYERPQSGRMRQFHQLGVEVFGSRNPETDVETMALAMDLFRAFGLKQLTLVVNSLGDVETRKAYREALIAFLEPHFENLSKDSQERLHKNPLRVLDSKDKKDQEIVKDAPSILDYLTEESASHFEKVKAMMDDLEIPYTIDHRMVRGLDYYTDTIFEIMSDAPGFGALTTICAGGRYNGLVEEVGGPETPGFGFAFGLERLLMTLDAENIEIPDESPLDVYVVGIGSSTSAETFKVVQALRQQGITAEKDFMNRKPKAQFKTADKLKARVVMTLGEDELKEGTISFKAMATGKQTKINLADIYTDNFKNQFVQELAVLTADEK